MANAWMVRAGQGGRYLENFRSQEMVAIGWSVVGDVRQYGNRKALIEALRSTIPDYSEGMAVVGGGQLFRFVNELKIGDKAVTYDSRARTYLCGVVTGEYCHSSGEEIDELSNRRAVKWEFERSRDDLSAAAKNTLGSILTLFLLPSGVESELWGGQKAKDVAIAEFSEFSDLGKTGLRPFVLGEVTFQEVEEQANVRITDRVAALNWSEMQDLVAGLLRAMGHIAEVSPAGPDRGRDIIASPDGMGFQEPRIVAEVKHRQGRMGAPEIRKFLGGRKAHEKGLFVSTGGFTQEALYEAERSSIPLTLLDSKQLIKFLLTHYPRLDEKTRQMLRLAPLYWPL